MSLIPFVLSFTLVIPAQLSAGASDPARSEALAEFIRHASGITAGLCVQVGCSDPFLPAALAMSQGGGRFLIHVIDPHPRNVAQARRILTSRGIYGQAWVECRSTAKLPYTENLVNLLIVDDLPRLELSLSEAMRVLVPGGVAWIGQRDAFAAQENKLTPEALKLRLKQAGIEDFQIFERNGLWARIVKHRPQGMGQWSHPRCNPGGNACSNDTFVGVPKRVRWVAGPPYEVSNMITAGGRIFYAGLIARDAFNGLPLWNANLTPTPMRAGYPQTQLRGSVLPVAAGGLVFVVERDELKALSAETGLPVRTYGKVTAPREILSVAGKLLVLEEGGVRAFEVESGELLWSHPASKPAGFVADRGGLFLLEGDAQRGQKRAIVKLNLQSGKVLWRRGDFRWATGVKRLTAAGGLLICEVSTFSDNKPGNAIHVLSAESGNELWNRSYEPGMTHYVQARAIVVGDTLWILHAGKWEGLDPRSGKTKKTLPAGAGHCYPPVASAHCLIAGELHVTEIESGRLAANLITKGACSRDAGFMPANGLIYCAPKHCSCWPMVAGYVALAPAEDAPSEEPGYLKAEIKKEEKISGRTKGPESIPGTQWPCYRCDPQRSGSSSCSVPAQLEILWSVDLGGWPENSLAEDWRQNLYVRGPITPPVVAEGLAIVALPDRHRVVALDALTGALRWEFTANGRVDTPPTIAGGLCLFGTRSGWLYALRVSDGGLYWRMRVAPNEERIIYYGQLESPWPVPGSVLVLRGTAYVAAGRHPLADGGIHVLALDPQTARVLWRTKIQSLPLRNYYAGEGLDVDPFDLLVVEDLRPGVRPQARSRVISMSRWLFDPATGSQTVAWKSGFAFHKGGSSGVMVHRGLWTYGPPMDYTPSGPPPGRPDRVHATRRPLAVFRGNTLFACSKDKRRLFCRIFSKEDIRNFNDTWYNQRQVPRRKDAPGDKSRSERLARGAKWAVELFPESGIGALVLAGDKLFAAGSTGGLAIVSPENGSVLMRRRIPAPVWDGMAAAYGRLYVSTKSGKLLSLGKGGETRKK